MDMMNSTTELRSVAVFCGSSPGNIPDHVLLARQLGAEIARRQLRLIYGGGGLGLMGAVARAAHQGGATVIGVIPDMLRKAEGIVPDIEHVFVPDMHTRKIRMYKESDAFIILPGGIGTLEEAVEVLSWQQLNLHEKPILFLSDTGYWDHLLAEFARIIDTGFARPSMRDDILSAQSIDEAFSLIQDRLDNPVERPPLVLRDASVESLI
ncbi:cytokinin riboside 5'-monophosphate phosphoribohydrolase [Algimonas porphyrae]|uniref:Cytokinin riboside 5'-monophosphate phosphoribohydrolase n=3 Tax=Algimonas porphyrae TaxID=1128113 RepID=A0ABQ5V1R9_9PROT|nr:cytokinin riboside 5'-monophosphate phosphoribohydrolase [Algimonas porphyrae]